MKITISWRKIVTCLLYCTVALLPLLYDIGKFNQLFMRAFKVFAVLFCLACFVYLLISGRVFSVIKNGKGILLFSFSLILISSIKIIYAFLQGESHFFFTAIEIPVFAVFAFFVYAFLSQNAKAIPKVVNIYTVVTTMSILFFPNRFLLNDYGAYRFVGIYLNPNSASLFFYVACFFALYLANLYARFHWIFLGMFSINAGAIILSSSRVSLLSLLMGCFIIGLFRQFPQFFRFSAKVRQKVDWKALIFIVVTMTVTVIVLQPTKQDKEKAFKLTSYGNVLYAQDYINKGDYQNKLADNKQSAAKDNTQEILDRFTQKSTSSDLFYRFEIWKEYGSIISDYFWIGTDFHQSNRPIVHSVLKATHNTYLCIFYMCGIFALITLIVMTFFLAIKFFRRKKKLSVELYLSALYCGIIFISLLHDLLLIPVYWFLMGLLSAVLCGEHLRVSQKQNFIRVLQIFPSLDKGGAESRTMDIYRKIDRSKVQFDFVILGVRKEGPESYFYYNEIISLGGHVFGMKSWHEIGMVKYLCQWKELLHKGSYQTVHSHSSVWSGCDLFPAWINGVPNRIAHARDSGLVPNVSRKQRISYWMLRWLTAAFSTEKIYCSREAADFSFGKNKYGGLNSHFLPNAVDLSRVSPLSDERRNILKKEIGLDGAECIVGTVGNARPVKNHIFLVKTFHRFLSYRDHAKLVIVGNDEEDGEAKEYVATNSLEDAVVFTGLRNDVPELLQLMDVFILPSFKEGAPGAVIEAQAANVPCILSDSITRDVDVGTGLIKYISLDEPLEIWVEEMLKGCTGARPAREETIQKLCDAGYDVESSCKKLLEIYKIA